MKLIVFFILVAMGIVAWALFGPNQQENMLAVKEAIGIDPNNPYATKLRKLAEKQEAITEALEGNLSSLDGAQLSGNVNAAQAEVSRELSQIIEALEREGNEEEIVIEIDRSGIIGQMRTIQTQFEDGKRSEAADGSRRCVHQMEEWARELDGSD